jgi:hypothetical protein
MNHFSVIFNPIGRTVPSIRPKLIVPILESQNHILRWCDVVCPFAIGLSASNMGI